MRQETIQKLSELAFMLRDVRTEKSYTLFVGGKSSTINGRAFLDVLQEQVLLAQWGKSYQESEMKHLTPNERIDDFEDKWQRAGTTARTAILKRLYQQLKITEGHQALALLLKEQYFPVVLTTAFDQCLETAFVHDAFNLQAAIPTWNILVHRQEMKQDSVEEAENLRRDFQKAIQSGTGTSILKLFGNLFNIAATQTDVERFMKPIAPSMQKALQSDLVMIGTTYLDEIVLQSYLTETSAGEARNIYYVNAEEPTTRELSRRLRRYEPEPIYIVDNELTFDTALRTIAEQLKLFQNVEKTTGRPLNQSDFEQLLNFIQANQDDQAMYDTLVNFIKNSRPQPSVSTEPNVVEADTLDPALGEDVANETAAIPPSDMAEDGPLVELVPKIEEEEVQLPKEPELIQLVRKTTIFMITINTERKVTFSVVGGTNLNYNSSTSDALKLDVDELNSVLQDMGQSIAAYHKMNAEPNLRESWRRQAKREGVNLYTNLVEAFPDLDRMLAVARSTAAGEDPENVTLVFNGPRHYLGMPYELLYYHNEPLVLSHPFCRKIEQVTVQHAEHFDTFFQSLRKNKQRLRVLLIASGTPGTTSDEQVQELNVQINQAASALGIKPIIDVLPTNKASIGEVRKRLQRCTYHIVHYAGHGTFDEATGENSGLRLWQRDNQGGSLVTLTAREMASLLRSSETRLFYLNSCVGASTSNEYTLRDNDYLGMMDALVHVGIPYVLGFRWYITDRSSRKFATLFYEHLFKRPLVPEKAVLYARKGIYEERAVNETWTAPILIAQTPYQ